MKNLISFEQKHPPEVDERYHVLDAGNIGNVLYWREFFTMTAKVPGAIVECGVGRGRSLLVVGALNRFLSEEHGGQRRIYGFDSFQGFDDPSPEDESIRKPKRGDWSHSPSGKFQYSPEFVREILTRARVPSTEPNPRIIKGYFRDSLESYDGGPVAMLHIDCDLYKPYLDVLNRFYELVQPGGAIIFDDFLYLEPAQEKFPGARKAVEEFFKERPEVMQESIRGTPYMVKH